VTLLKTNGFTLSELLISLAILGVIAAFTIPKILSSQNDAQRKAVFKETYATITTIIYNGLQQGELPRTSPNMYDFVSQKINAVKLCDTHSFNQGCWPQSSDCTWAAAELAEPGMVLPSGAVIAGLRNGLDYEGFLVDWNGPAEPNTCGNDQISLIYQLSNSLPTIFYPDGTESETLFSQLF